MKITEEEKQLRKDRIIRTAFRLFCQYGIEKVTLAQIAEEADVGDTSVYRYFCNKPQLVKETLRILWKQIGLSLEGKAQETEAYDSMTGLEQLKILLEGCRKLYLENSDYVLFSYETKLYLMRNHVKLLKRQYDNLMYEIKEPYVKAIEKGKTDGTIPTEEDSEDLFYAIWGSVRGYIVKIVIYKSLCLEGSPWEARYEILEKGIVSALASGWKVSKGE